MNGPPRKPVGQDLPGPFAAARRRWAHIPSCTELAYRHMARLIRSGMLRAGDALPPERMLGSVFDIGRGSVRIVLDRLRHDGVIRICHGKSTRVTGTPLPRGTPFCSVPTDPCTPRAQSVIEHARRRVSTLAIGAELCQVNALAARRLGLLGDMQHAASDLPQFVIIDCQFHAELQTCYPTPKFASLLRLAGALAHSGLRDVFEAEAVRREVAEQHRAIVLALERKDINAAIMVLCDQLEMRVAAYRAPECETPTNGCAQSLGGVAETTPLQDYLGMWRRCSDSS